MGNDKTVDLDIALFSNGITPNIDFLPKELETDSGKITVNDKYETNIKDVYAIGDCIFNKYSSYSFLYLIVYVNSLTHENISFSHLCNNLLTFLRQLLLNINFL